MSFILDALKKSENERQRQSGPAMFEVKVAPPRSRFPLWAVIVGALLGVNLIVLIVVLLLRDARHDGAAAPGANPATATTTAAAPASAAPPAATGSSAATNASPATAAPGNVLTTPVAPAAPPANAATSRFNPPLVEEPGATEDPDEMGAVDPANAAAMTPGPAAAQAGPPAALAGAATRTAGIPSRDDLIASGLQVPEVAMSLHAFDRNPASRFVFINGQRAREGEVLANGLKVEQVVPDGAILSFRGSRFLVPLQ
ncbi:MAG: general secretion pathway protein GspB [Steroidobacteraceae bacterium]